jgi:Saxitoxin biosynthesis operon protein SxtJ
MSLIRINRNPSGRQLAVFAAAWLVFLGAIGAKEWMRGRPSAAEVLWALAAAAPIAGFVSREALRLLYLGLSHVTRPIGVVVSLVVLAAVYYLALAPIGLTMRLFGHDPLSRKFEPGAPTYWKPRKTVMPVASYFDQS